MFKYTRAGHLPPIVLDGFGKVIEIGMDQSQPLGLFEEVNLDMQEVVIRRGGLALLFSDGLNEASDSQGNEFGFESIKRELFCQRGEQAKIICEKLWQAVEVHSGDMPHQDDFTAMVVKRLE